MYLVIDLEDLNIGVDEADVKINKSDNLNIGELLTKLCDGINEILDYNAITAQSAILSKGNSPLNNSNLLSSYSFNDWDTISLRRR